MNKDEITQLDLEKIILDWQKNPEPFITGTILRPKTLAKTIKQYIEDNK